MVLLNTERKTYLIVNQVSTERNRYLFYNNDVIMNS